MRLARIRTDGGAVSDRYDDGAVTADGEEYEAGVDAELLAPCDPTALYCVGRNCAAMVDRTDYNIPDQPDWFIKPPVSVLDPGADIGYPDWADELTYAGELAAVIDRECFGVTGEDVDEAVRGYTILNDLDALDQPGRMARKAFDDSGLLGPWIEADVEPSNTDMTTHVGGELWQEASTERMLPSPAKAVSFLSERYTFQPDDVILFGSPANPGLVEPGDDVEVRYKGVGTLTNRVVDSE